MSSAKTADPTLSLASGTDHAHLFRNTGAAEQVEHAAAWLQASFDAYYSESRGIPERARLAFEQRDPGTSLVLSRRRLSLYSRSINILGAWLKEVAPGVTGDPRRVFRRIHADLLTVEYWQAVQDALQAGQVPSIRIHPQDSDLRSAPVEHDA